MDIRYPISKLFQVAFGINSPVYISTFDKGKKPDIDYGELKTLPDYYEPDAKSWMGTPIMFSATFKGRNYFQYDKKAELKQVTLNDFALPPATMFSFRRAKNITKTTVLGSNGTVKEIYGFDDWIIDMRGLCLDEPNRSAAQQIEEFMKWEGLADGIEVSGKLFNQHDVGRVVMMDWQDNVVQGSPGVIAFQAQLCSDDGIIMEFL